MQEVEYNNVKLKLFDSIEELPILNYHKYNRYLLIDSGIGSSIEDIDAHIIKVAKLIDVDRDKAIQELQNMRQSIFMIGSEISPKNMAFAALIYSINGEPVTDYSEDGLKRILGRLNKVPQSRISKWLEELKKKLSEELKLYFPTEFGISAKERANEADERKRVISILSKLAGDEVEESEEEIEKRMVGRYKPRSYYGASSVEIEYNKQFESSCILISQKTSSNARVMSTLTFYNSLDLIKKQFEAESKAYKSVKTHR